MRILQVRALCRALGVKRRKDHELLPAGGSQSNRGDDEVNGQLKCNVLSAVSVRFAGCFSGILEKEADWGRGQYCQKTFQERWLLTVS